MSKIYGGDNQTAAEVDKDSHALYTSQRDAAGFKDKERGDIVQLLEEIRDLLKLQVKAWEIALELDLEND